MGLKRSSSLASRCFLSIIIRLVVFSLSGIALLFLVWPSLGFSRGAVGYKGGLFIFSGKKKPFFCCVRSQLMVEWNGFF